MSVKERVTEFSSADIVGDLLAAPGTKEWCLGMRFRIQQLLDSHAEDHEGLQRCVASFVSEKGWQALRDARGRPFPSYTEFCKARRPHGLERAPEEIEAIIAEGIAKKDAQALAADPEVTPLAEADTTGRNNSTVDNVNGRPTGNSASYIVRRLKRDAPKVAEALARGEYPSARAAGIAAGIVKVPSPLDLLRRAWLKASKQERQTFMDEKGNEGW
jgi:hypothetical protein